MTVVFSLRHEDGDEVRCESCSCVAPVGLFDRCPSQREVNGGILRPLCEFCASTMAGRYTEYSSPDLYVMLRAEVWRAAAGVFNMLAQKKEDADVRT